MMTLAWILAATLAISFLCSVLEATFLSITHSHVGLLRESGHWAGAWYEKAQKKVEEPIVAILTLNTLANTMGAAVGGAVAGSLFGSTAVAIFSALLTFSVLIFAEILPKTLGATYWKQLSIPSAYVLRFMVLTMRPVIVPLGWIGRVIARSSVPPTVSRSEIEVLADIGRREGALDEDEWNVVSRVIRLDEVSIGSVMTPRTDMTAVPITATVSEAKRVMLDTGHLRIPVFDGTIDNIVGVVVARDLWRADQDGVDILADVMRSAPFSPSSKPVEDLISEMRAQRIKMAIVVDEFGGTAGLVTLEDLIEEIIGEIQDEHEEDEPVDFLEQAGGRVQVWGGVSLRDSAARLKLEPNDEEEEGYDTVGGFVLGRLNRIPVVGDQVDVASGSLRVTRMTGRRVDYLLFVPGTADLND
ncbi:MAG: HlyC/CorC family transporter [Gemmatimonadales bacterium]|jgi:putative hemolysin|nr:HlyC/CorC family transporter [Gemmatimonadales bacterium]MBT3497839.1 HlyC/CorC family transporter [Gemmatimonadales bacterium]MBT3774662.1 HlyC/CorC family transporter [Gemmatimonadales bacterium]MBT3958746.1 HlyC/CorC family transporter [Gemmatimonadales bacterium]MBT4186183.1 HlyC/CorC family transporter [Gemmatimonadales bacterium]